jgi:selenocysteine lyase/cysteine desulfurase
MGICALSASLSLIQETGIEAIHHNISSNVSYLCDRVVGLGLELISSRLPQRHAGIMTFRHTGKDSRQVYKRLQAAGVLCALRAGGVRLSPHFYTPREDLDRALTELELAVT